MAWPASSDPLPISLVAHTVFCRRRAWLEAAGETVESANIEFGTAAHARVDGRADERSARRESVEVHHEELGIAGRCDVLRPTSGGLHVIEYKSAPGRRSFEVTEAQRIQLALQGLCLESQGQQVAEYAVYFTTARRTVSVPLTDEDRASAMAYVAATRDVVDAPVAPAPLVDDPRCSRCSHAGVCLPDEHRQAQVRRRIQVADPLSEVLHLTVPGSHASLRAGRVLARRGEEELANLPIDRVSAIVVHGNVDLTSGLIRELLWRTCPILWCSGRGRVIGYAATTMTPNGLARVDQHTQSAAGRLDLARAIVAGKIANQATLLRRLAKASGVLPVIARMRQLQALAAEAGDGRQLLGIEGDAARMYFSWFAFMLNDMGRGVAADFGGRQGRGAGDALNVALNFAYGLLLGDVTRAVLACGLDPHAGFIHSSGRNKPALALDLMEEFRPVVADSVIVGALNNGELTDGDFTRTLGDCRLRDSGRKAITKAYERRIHQEFRHPVFQYRLTWRRAMEVQARMILGVLEGSQPDYRPLRPR